jgi:DNA-directed RNA polymerase subunit N (RpoN/RPB10)
MADKADYYEQEVNKLKAEKSKNKETLDPMFKNFDKIHTGHILDQLGLTRYCCRRNLISNVDMMDII